MRRISGLLKTKNDVIAELFGSFIVHIFDENAELFGCSGAHLFRRIAHFDCGIQDGLTKLFTDVAGAV